MNLVNELQVSAERDDVLTVLRKAKRLASKLDRQDIAGWLQAEQNGYADDQPVPEYRQIGTTVAYKTHGYVPAGYGMLVDGLIDFPSAGAGQPIDLPDSISVVLTMIQNLGNGQTICFPIDEGTDFSRAFRKRCFHPSVAHRISLLFRLNGSHICAIPDRIKDKVLDWACALDRAGVIGEGLTFSAEEKQIAHSVTFNITDSTIGQLTNSGTNQRSGK